jgi:hypothetical protein
LAILLATHDTSGQIDIRHTLDILPKDELLKILMANSNLTMPIEKQKAAVQAVLETLQQVQPTASVFPTLLERKFT